MSRISNHKPTLETLAASCLVSSMRCSSVISSHSAVPYSVLHSGVMPYLSVGTGASQSTSTVGS